MRLCTLAVPVFCVEEGSSEEVFAAGADVGDMNPACPEGDFNVRPPGGKGGGAGRGAVAALDR